jgi:hypothetical protein
MSIVTVSGPGLGVYPACYKCRPSSAPSRYIALRQTLTIMQKPAGLGQTGEYQVGSIDPMLPSEALRAGSEDQTNRITCRQLPFHDVSIASNTLRWIVRAGAVWQLLSGNFRWGTQSATRYGASERIISSA